MSILETNESLKPEVWHEDIISTLFPSIHPKVNETVKRNQIITHVI